MVYTLLFNHPLAPQIVAGGFLILPLFCCILAMHVIACVKCVEESRKLLRIVSGVKSLEHYSIYLTHDTCRITVYEMFNVNFEIVFIVSSFKFYRTFHLGYSNFQFYATILTYVIILVQFNVAEYMLMTNYNMTG
jgi:hypothetical protein